MRKKLPTIVAICETCADYAEEGAALYRHGDSYRHLGNNRNRCPGQEDDDTDDRAVPLTFAQFREEFDPDLVTLAFVILLERIAQAAGGKLPTPHDRYAVSH